MEFIRDLLANLGLIVLLAAGMMGASSGAESIGNAFERQRAAETASLELHKLDYPANDDANDDNYVTDPMNGFDDEVIDIYETSDEAKTARHANLFIAEAYGRE